ncbi:hypothetical protein FisN_13Lh328 [Fistulifera solaris]|uniref:BEACH domain-containing protein n=1 Tax=Fistulifera solaris TaxID=1519565 RepID=A0A1Z5KLD2_FISSO|nr:hypothetical protein FisN_13Lh328 [Fistulifera solaris]|eukprot:GAX27124.1 hypothetical protein FisN_13Lh328 [Fistulifera solaris]
MDGSKHQRQNLPSKSVSAVRHEEEDDLKRHDERSSSDRCMEHSLVRVIENGIQPASFPSELINLSLEQQPSITDAKVVDLSDADFQNLAVDNSTFEKLPKVSLKDGYRGGFQPVRATSFTTHSVEDDHCVESSSQPESVLLSSLRGLLEEHIPLTNIPADPSDDYTTEAHILGEIFAELLIPALPLEVVKSTLDQERLCGPVKVDLPDVTIAMQPNRVRALLTAKANNSFLLLQLPEHFSKAFLRILTKVLSNETDDEYDQGEVHIGPVVLNPPPLADHSTVRPHTRYNVSRLQCSWPGENRPAISDLLRLVEAASPGKLSRSLARLLGLLAIGGVTTHQLREWMNLAQKQSLGAHARLALVQAMRTAALGSSRSHVLKSSPRHFFCFNQSEGLQKTIHGLPHWPFRNDFGMALWFRAERFDGNPILFSARSDDGGGIEVSLAKVDNPVSHACTIIVSIFDSNIDEPAHQLKVNGYVMLPRVWYHLAIRHSQSRLKGVFSLGARYQISILIDGKTMTTNDLPFPKVSRADFDDHSSSILNLRKISSTQSRLNMELCLGKDFDGETGALYLFNDSVSDASFRALFDATGGKAGALRKLSGTHESWDAKASSLVRESRVLDDNSLENFVPKSRKRRVCRDNALSVIDIEIDNADDKDDSEIPIALQKSAFACKIFASWDPKRVVGKQVVELRLGAHANIKSTRSWSLNGLPDVIKSLGGVQSVFQVLKSFISPNCELGMDGGTLAFILPSLFEMIYAFINDDSDNARELLRCGGIDVMADLLTTSKKVATGKILNDSKDSIYGSVCSDVEASTHLVQSLVRLQSCCSNNVALEAKILSRLIFNVSLWLDGSSLMDASGLHTIILPVLSQITRSSPETVRDCVKIKDLVKGLSSSISSATAPHESTIEKIDHIVSTIILGIIFSILSVSVTVKDLSPLLNFIASIVAQRENGKASFFRSKKDSAVGACVVLLFLFKQRPIVSGLFESFAQCCGSVHNGAAWIVCSLINVDDEEIRALGIRTLDAYIKVTSKGPDDVLSLGTSMVQGRDEATNGNEVTVNAIRASNRIRERLAQSLTAMGATGRMSTPASPRVVYKFVWHVLKSRRYQLSHFTNIALLHMSTDDDDLQSASTTEPSFDEDCLIAPIRGPQPGYSLCLDRVRKFFTEKGELINKSLVNPLATGLILRLLRFLTEDQKDEWIRDLFSLANASRKNVALLASLPDWEPPMFHLISDTMESVRRTSSKRVQDEETSNLASRFVMRLDVVLDIYSALLGHLLRVGTEKVVDTVEKTASLERTCVNGTEVLLMILSRFCSNLFDYGAILEIGSFSAEAWKDIDLDHDSLPLKQSAKLVTDAITNQGNKQGLDMVTAVRTWRSLRHLAEVIVAMTIKSSLGTVEMFDYRIQRAAAEDSVTGGLHGFRLPDGRLHGISAKDFARYSESEPTSSAEESKAVRIRLSVSLSAQILMLLDAFLFPDSLESVSPIPKMNYLALVKNSEARLGSSQGPLVSSAMRLSFVLLALLEPCSVKFLQCVSRLHTLIDWALELVGDGAIAGHGQPISAFQHGVAHIDRLLLAALLHSHRALARSVALLSEIEFSFSRKYFENRESQKKHLRRLLRSTKKLHEIVSEVFQRRNDLFKAALSNEAYEALLSSLTESDSIDKATKDQSIRIFLKSKWVQGFQDVENRCDLAIPEQVSIAAQDGASKNDTTMQGFLAIEQLSKESHDILIDFEKALDDCFTSYLESQRKWAETDAVRDIEYDGDIILKRLSEKYKSDCIDVSRDTARRRSAAEQRWKAIERLVIDPWREPKHWMIPKWTDKMGRKQILMENTDFDSHLDARYATEDEDKAIFGDGKTSERNLTEVMRRNADAFNVSEGLIDEELLDDDCLLASDGESTVLESMSETSEALDEIEELKAIESKTIQDTEIDASWDKISSEEVDGDEDGDIDGWAKNYIWSHGESVVGRFNPVMIISLQSYVEGTLLMTTDSLYFLPSSAEINIMTKESVERLDADSGKGKRWKLTQLTEIHGRRYLLRHQAVELFFADMTDLLLNFPSGPRERDRFHTKLRSYCKSKMTDLWKKRKISTFEYLIAINRMAGRSFNDLANYPVFPWVLADYKSESIDLDDFRVYRDLTKPIGALNQDRLTQLLERYNELEAFGFTEAEKFLYGSHYSSPGIVLHFLMRQEPFTTMHIQLQSGRFDCADRLFLDVASSWRSCMTSSSDMKELVPEFFYLPEMFLNTNGFPLGRTQSGHLVHDVGLPPWAKGSAYEFVRINRLALESEFVSQNLSHWIDLVFGFKQRGPEAEAAHNIFHHLSYEGSVDLDKITSQVDREAAESHIQNFGQTPCQLIALDPHPTRGLSEECWKPLISDTTIAGRLKCYTPSKQFSNMRSEYAKGAVVKLLVLADAVYGIYADMSIGSYRFNSKSKDNRLRMDRLRPLPARELSTSRLSLKKGSEIASTAMDDSRYAVGPSSFALAMTGVSKEDLRKNSVIPSNILMSHGTNNVASLEGRFFMASSTYWDETIKIHSADGCRVVASEAGGHNGPIRVVTTGDGGGIVASGGEDATVRIWVLDDPDLANALCDAYVQTALGSPSDGEHLLRCCHVLWGHDSPITSLALNLDLDVVVSGSQTGRICIHSVHRGEFIRSFTPAVLTKSANGTIAVGSIALGSSGLLVVHCEDHSLHTFTLNAVQLSSRRTGEKLHDMRLCGNDQFLITGGEACQVKVWTVPDLRVCAVLDLAKHGPIRCIGLTPEDLNPAEQFLFIGSDDGMITIVDNDHFGKNSGSQQF